MKKMIQIPQILAFLVFIFLLNPSSGFSQNLSTNEDGAAVGESEDNLLTESPKEIKKEDISEKKAVNMLSKPAETTPVSLSPQPVQKSKKELRKEQRRQKIANSPFVQWLVKRAMIKAEKKSLRKELKEVKHDKEAQKVLREKSEQKIKALNSNVRLGLILVLVGILLSILGTVSGVFYVLGTIAIVIGIVFIILGLI